MRIDVVQAVEAVFRQSSLCVEGCELDGSIQGRFSDPSVVVIVDLPPRVVSGLLDGLVLAAIIHDIGIPAEVVDLLKRPNIHAEILTPAKWPDYPYPEGQQQLRDLYNQVGAAKLLWGSDSPFGMSAWCTYRQAIDFIRRHCDFLSNEEKDLILGGNAARLFGIEAQ